MGGIYLFNSFISNFYKIYTQRNFVEYKYGALISFIGLMISWVIAFFYNKYYTQKMLADGYYPEENDEYSIALLKEFTYIPYTKEELEDKSIREKYKKFSDFARTEERDKFKIWVVILIIGNLFVMIKEIRNIITVLKN